MVRTSFIFDDDKELVQLARGYQGAELCLSWSDVAHRMHRTGHPGAALQQRLRTLMRNFENRVADAFSLLSTGPEVAPSSHAATTGYIMGADGIAQAGIEKSSVRGHFLRAIVRDDYVRAVGRGCNVCAVVHDTSVHGDFVGATIRGIVRGTVVCVDFVMRGG